MNKAYQKSLSRTAQGDGLDFWRTPPQATEALLERVPFRGSILEPACGIGDMSEVIKSYYSDVTSMDITQRGYASVIRDFLVSEKDFFSSIKYNNVITNPPFILAEEFVRKALSVATHKVAMLLKLEFLQSTKRLSLFKNYPPRAVYVFSYRIPFWQEGYDKPINNQRHAWYVWEQGYRGNPELEWIAPPESGVDRDWWK